MESKERLSKAMSMAEVAAADMREAGLSPQEICIGLAAELHRQASLAMPYEKTRRMWLESLVS
jgi:hypothetical protein